MKNMIEKINEKKGNWLACNEVIHVLTEMKAKDKNKALSVAEIGVDIGATAVEILKFLDENDKYYMFDFEDKCHELESDFRTLPYVKATVISCGNTNRTYDSYSWTLQKMYRENKSPEFDLVYLDGAHTFFHDALTLCLLKKMTKDDGIIVIDDMDWSFKNSPTCNPDVNPSVLNNYTQEQIECPQISVATSIIMDDDKDWYKLSYLCTTRRSVYKKGNRGRFGTGMKNLQKKARKTVGHALNYIRQRGTHNGQKNQTK